MKLENIPLNEKKTVKNVTYHMIHLYEMLELANLKRQKVDLWLCRAGRAERYGK